MHHHQQGIRSVMNSTILSLIAVVSVATFTADAMVFGLPLGGVWRTFRGSAPLAFNFMQTGENAVNGVKFVPATVAPAVAMAPITNPTNNPTVVGSIATLATGNNFGTAPAFGRMGSGGFNFQF